jgi:hypothetical protein
LPSFFASVHSKVTITRGPLAIISSLLEKHLLKSRPTIDFDSKIDKPFNNGKGHVHSVNTDNWTYCRYQKGNFLALVTFGTSPELATQDRLEYYVTVLENETNEIFQQEFSTLADACLYLNAHYADWSFEDQTAEKSGCSTCAAH